MALALEENAMKDIGILWEDEAEAQKAADFLTRETKHRYEVHPFQTARGWKYTVRRKP